MPEKIEKRTDPLFSIGRLFLMLITGWAGIILLLCLIFRIQPVDFFSATSDSVALNISYFILLYFLILTSANASLKLDGKNGLAELGFGLKSNSLKWIMMSCLMTLLLFSLYVFVLTKNGAGFSTFPPSIRLVLKSFFLGFLISAVEEILFRGYLLQRLTERYPFLPSAVCVSVFFALLHILRPGSSVFKAVYFIGIFSIGMVLSFLYQTSGTLWFSIGIHAVWISCMYIFSEIITGMPEGTTMKAFLFGMEKTPAGGLLGIVMIVLSGVISTSLYRKNVKIRTE